MNHSRAAHGFDLMEERAIPELNARAFRYRHRKTGADFLSLRNSDENKVFGITFRTLPTDSTGIAHILEHSVLCGSEKYPVKEPFVELLKGSLKTFLNAFTFPDKTCYPVASPNARDLYNLMEVYLDAVFHPRLTPTVLRQEGWHMHQESPDSPITLQGVVYNEMKGAYSSPDALLGEALQQALFPDTPYGLDSGGDPRHIPDLTWTSFQAFHRRAYHPSNALIFMAGDDDPAERLRRLDVVLSAFDAADGVGEIPLQPSFDGPRRVCRPFCADREGPDAGRGLAAMCWGLPDPLDPGRVLSFEVLAHILLGTSASPLSKALIDSGLGEGLAAAGLETQLRQMYLAAGLRGIRPEDTEAMEAVVTDTLRHLTEHGVDRDLVEASLNTAEFILREQNTGAFPRGLALMLRALPGWLHGADPIDQIAFEKPLAALKKAASEPGYFEDLIGRYLLDNPHRATVTLEPDPDMAARLEVQEQERIDRMVAPLSTEERMRVVSETRALLAAQERPDAAEDLARIPTLSIDDLPARNSSIPERVREKDPTYYLHPLPTRGIVYLDVGWNIRGVSSDRYPLVPIFARALLETGTSTQGFVSLSRRIGRETGGISACTWMLSHLDDGRAMPVFRLTGKALAPRTHALLALMKDILHDAQIQDQVRIGQLIREAKAGAEAMLLEAGHSVVARRLSARLEESAWIAEQMEGVDALFSLRALAQRMKTDGEGVCAELAALRDALLRSADAFVNITAEPDTLDRVRKGVSDLADAWPVDVPAGSGAWARPAEGEHEALTAPTQVNYVGLGGDLFATGYRFHGAARIAARLLSTGWLWERVRVQGGAYGAFFHLSRATGTFTFVSYRDPHVAATLETYRRSAAWLRDAAADNELRRRAILGTIGEMDAPKLPDAKGRTATVRRRCGDDDARRDRLRAEVLSTSEKDLRAFADALDAALPHGRVAALGSPDSLRNLAAAVSGPVLVTPVLGKG